MSQFDLPLLARRASYFQQRPAILQLEGEDLRHVAQTPCSFQQQNRTNWYWIDNNDFTKKHYYRPKRREDKCVPLAGWQDELHPSCLDFHVINFEELEYAAHGNMRDTWMYREHDGTKRALKMLRALNTNHNHTFDYVNTERHRMDAIASMVLSQSPYVADIYGHCGNSAIYDFADGGHLWTIFNKPPPQGDGPEIPPTKDELFKFAHDAAMGLADAHHLDSKGRLTILHKDIKPSQFIRMSDRIQLNDFNICMFPSWDPERNDYCNADEVKILEDADVNRLGELFNFMLLRGKRPYDDPTTVTSPINSTHPLDVYVKRAMNMCLGENPSSAKMVARLLHAGFSKFGVAQERKTEDWRRRLNSKRPRHRNWRAMTTEYVNMRDYT